MQTHSILCAPILDPDGEIIGVAKVVNKIHHQQKTNPQNQQNDNPQKENMIDALTSEKGKRKETEISSECKREEVEAGVMEKGEGEDERVQHETGKKLGDECEKENEIKEDAEKTQIESDKGSEEKERSGEREGEGKGVKGGGREGEGEGGESEERAKAKTEDKKRELENRKIDESGFTEADEQIFK